MVSLTAVLENAAIDRNQFNDWLGLARKNRILRTKFQKTQPGIARELSQENAFEVSFLSALLRAGMDRAGAVQLANDWIRELRSDTLVDLFAINPRTGEGIAFGDRNLSFHDLRVALSDDIPGNYVGEAAEEIKLASQINIIDRAEIVKGVLALFNLGGSQ